MDSTTLCDAIIVIIDNVSIGNLSNCTTGRFKTVSDVRMVTTSTISSIPGYTSPIRPSFQCMGG